MMTSRRFFAAAMLAMPLAMAGCLVDDGPDYVPGSTTVIERDNNPDVIVTPSAPNVIIQKDSPPPKVDVTVHTPPIEIKTQPPSKSTTGY